ncbi:dihydrofolate reductase family protein [uncultured Microbacterium sp.]|uniref:Bifunctional deaminase-reductase domain protein n=1 Tax=uncultured Microbacterium sp. TaxID=191216 RepID=A0A1Y5P9E1_9MICO|nr:dihydrofolate reductase family protein [uncultured Microbacterium sp.]SBS72548.1 Bifunctional deaminase-reductase domain protein [uncultured Microbacterium sp.]
MTGRIVIDIFMTLDGVAQAPGGPDEDPSSGFPYGGWQAPFADRASGEQIVEGITRIDALLLGRRTYDIFAAYWPGHAGQASVIADVLNGVPKYVASRGTPTLDWAESTLLGPDLSAEIAALRDRYDETHVIGSIDFAHSLLDAGLFDELNLWVYPLVLGRGKKVFPEGAVPSTLRLVEPPFGSETGAVRLRYAPAGPVTTGDMGADDRGA